MKKFIFLIIGSVIYCTSFSQVQTITNQIEIGTTFMETYVSSIKLSDGGYLLSSTTNAGVSGSKTSPSSGGSDIWIIKLDATYNIVWQRAFGGSGDDEVHKVLETTEGHILIGGTTKSTVSGNQTVGNNGLKDYWLIKLDVNGDIIWQNSYGGTDYDVLENVVQISPTKYLCSGNSFSSISGDKTENCRGIVDVWLVMVDSSGTILWDKTYGGTMSDVVTDVLYFQNTGEIVVLNTSDSDISGEKAENSYGNIDAWLLKIDTLGALISQKTIGGSDYDDVTSLLKIDPNSFFIIGSSNSVLSGNKTSSNFGGADAWVLKVDLGFLIVSDNVYGGNLDDDFINGFLCNDGQLIFYGSSTGSLNGNILETNNGLADCWILSLNGAGNVNWSELIGGTDSEGIFGMYETSDNNYSVITGSFSVISGDKTVPNFGNSDFWLFDLTTTLGVQENSKTPFSLYPNPVLSNGTITTSLFNTNYEILDLQGRSVQNGTIKNQTIQLQNLQSGIYTLIISGNSGNVTKRIVVE